MTGGQIVCGVVGVVVGAEQNNIISEHVIDWIVNDDDDVGRPRCVDDDELGQTLGQRGLELSGESPYINFLFTRDAALHKKI